MAINYAKWDKAYGVTAETVNELKNNKREIVEVPYGKYEVKINKMTLTESKKGNPMMSVWFSVLEGQYKNQLIFMNQLLTNEYGIHNCNEFMRSLDSGMNIVWTGSYGAYADMIDSVFKAVISSKLEYALDYYETDKGYSAFKITEVYEAE